MDAIVLSIGDELVLGRYVGRGVAVAVFLAGGYAQTPEQTARLHLGAAAAAEEACRDSPHE